MYEVNIKVNIYRKFVKNFKYYGRSTLYYYLFIFIFKIKFNVVSMYVYYQQNSI